MSMETTLLLKSKLEAETPWETILMLAGSLGGLVHRGLCMVSFHLFDIVYQNYLSLT